MKNSKDYSGKVKKVFRAWKRSAGDLHPAAVYDEPLEALLVALISEHRNESDGRKVYKRIQNNFVDYNDLRVSRNEEIFELMGDQNETSLAAAQAITKILNQVYSKYDRLSLIVLKEGGKRQGRKELEELEGISRFAIDYCFTTALGGHAIPLTESMTALLRREELVYPEATDDEIHGFLERQISASDGWAFYSLLRSAAEGHLNVPSTAGRKTKKKAARKTTKKKTTKKKTKKKKTKSTKKTVRKK